jgi:hypothetical protein
MDMCTNAKQEFMVLYKFGWLGKRLIR